MLLIYFSADEFLKYIFVIGVDTKWAIIYRHTTAACRVAAAALARLLIGRCHSPEQAPATMTLVNQVARHPLSIKICGEIALGRLVALLE